MPQLPFSPQFRFWFNENIYNCFRIFDWPLWNCCAECLGRLQLLQLLCPQGLDVLQPGSGHWNTYVQSPLHHYTINDCVSDSLLCLSTKYNYFHPTFHPSEPTALQLRPDLASLSCTRERSWTQLMMKIWLTCITNYCNLHTWDLTSCWTKLNVKTNISRKIVYSSKHIYLPHNICQVQRSNPHYMIPPLRQTGSECCSWHCCLIFLSLWSCYCYSLSSGNIKIINNGFGKFFLLPFHWIISFFLSMIYILCFIQSLHFNIFTFNPHIIIMPMNSWFFLSFKALLYLG